MTDSPDDRAALTDVELTELIRKVEDNLGIVWFVPDDSETYLWRTTNTNERLKYSRALLTAASQPQPGTCAALTDDDILRAAIKHGIGAMPILKGARYSEFTDTERLVLFARTLMRLTASQPQPVNRADSVDVAIALEQQRALHIVQAVRTQGFAKSDTALPTQAESVFDLACEEIGHRLRTEVWELGGVPMPVNRADGDAVPVHDHPSTEAGDYLPIDFGDAVPVAWYIPDDNGAPYRTTGYCGEALEWKMKGKTVLPLYDAPPASKSADALTDFQTFAINRAISVFEDVMGDIADREDDSLAVAVAGTITDLRSALAVPQPQPVNRGVPNKLSVREKASNSNNLVWPEGYCLDPNGKMSCPDGAYPHWSFGYDMGYAEALALRTNVIKDALAQIRSASVPVNRADGDVYAAQCSMIRALRDDCERESKKTDCYTCYTEQAAYMVKRLNTILLAPPIGSWDKGRTDGDAVPVATVHVTAKGYAMRLSTYVAYALPEGKHDLYAAPPASTSANAQAPVARPVATLHDDGYYTWNPAVDKPSGYNYAGWRMEVFAAPIASALPTTPIDGKKS